MSVSSSAPQFIAIIGPIACGKRALASKYFHDRKTYTEIQPSHYSHKKIGDRTKNQRILTDVQTELSASKNVVMVNSGGLFVDTPEIFTSTSNLTVIAPDYLVNFVNKWPVTVSKISLQALSKSQFIVGMFRQIETEGPCRNAYLSIMDMIHEQVEESCDYRLRINFYQTINQKIVTPVGKFIDRNSLVDELDDLNKKSFYHQIILIMWARFNNHTVIPFTYDKSDYTVSCDF